LAWKAGVEDYILVIPLGLILDGWRMTLGNGSKQQYIESIYGVYLAMKLEFRSD
jgi:hypothetical protein